jgi:hypothetical protein
MPIQNNSLSNGNTLSNSTLGNSLNTTSSLNALNNSGIDPGLQVSNTGTFARASSSKWDDFEVVGNKIYDPNGREFIAKGVNINGPGYGWPGDTPNQVDNIKKWGFNAVRLNVRELGFEQKSTYAQNGTVDQIVRNFTSQGIVVMIDAHENIGGWFTGSELDKLVDWGKNLGSKYKDNPYVWINLSNEPGALDSGSQSAINNYTNQYTKTLKAIRSTGFDNPIVIDGWFWGQDKGVWNGNPVQERNSAILSLGPKLLEADPVKNTLFSVHTYDQWRNNSKATFDNYVDRIHDKGLALVVGEYGTRTNGDLKDMVSGVLSSAQENEVGRFVWAWWGGDAFDLTTTGNGGAPFTQYKSNGSMPGNLTWMGQQVWQDNRRAESLQMRSGGGSNSGAPLPPPQTPPINPPVPAPAPSPTPTPAPGNNASYGNPIRYEAESLSLSNYKLESNAGASGGKRITLANTGNRSGVASGTFNGATGDYIVKVGFFDEADGVSNVTVKAGGQSSSFSFNQNTKSGTQKLEKTLFSSGIRMKAGDRFEIAGNAGGDEWARVDWVEFVPVKSANSSNQPPAGAAPLPATAIRVEAESLALNGYRTETNSKASGGKQISLLNSGQTTGTASGVFNGTSGSYSVKIKYLDETDGSSRGTVSIGGKSANFNFDQKNSANTTIEKVLFPSIQLKSGDRFEIKGASNADEWARVDWIEFTPV